MHKISCPICLDLMPLVKDDVASSDSRSAVMQHLAACEACQQAFEEFGTNKPRLNEKRVLARIKKRLALAALIMVAVGAFIGLGLSDSSLVFYNILIMPAIGALGYFALKEKSYFIPLAMLPFVYLWYFVKYLLSGEPSYQVLLFSPLFWGLIYAGLCALGTLVAFLLHFAFRKEDESNADIV